MGRAHRERERTRKLQTSLAKRKLSPQLTPTTAGVRQVLAQWLQQFKLRQWLYEQGLEQGPNKGEMPVRRHLNASPSTGGGQ